MTHHPGGGPRRGERTSDPAELWPASSWNLKACGFGSPESPRASAGTAPPPRRRGRPRPPRCPRRLPEPSRSRRGESQTSRGGRGRTAAATSPPDSMARIDAGLWPRRPAPPPCCLPADRRCLGYPAWALCWPPIPGGARDVRRFRSEAAFAAVTGTAPIPAASGQSQRHRLNRGGNR